MRVIYAHSTPLWLRTKWEFHFQVPGFDNLKVHFKMARGASLSEALAYAEERAREIVGELR